MKASHLILISSLLFVQCKKSIESNKEYPQTPNYHTHYSPGSSAKDFLRSNDFHSLRIEIQYMPGLRPQQNTIDIFIEMLRERLNKPSGIFIEFKEIDPTLQTMFSVDDISDIESLNRTVYTGGDQLGAYVILVDGSSYDGNALALAYHNTSICIFGDPLQYFSGGFTEDAKAKIMAVLLMHEFGHLLGLVDMGSNMVAYHADHTNANHCSNSNCLMHHTYTTNTRYAVSELSDVPTFDNNCINDLKANGGK